MKPSNALAIWLGVSVALVLSTLGLNVLIRFADAGNLWLMAIPVVLSGLFLLYLLWRQHVAELLGTPSTVHRMAGTYSARRLVARGICLIAAATLLVFAAARPQWGEQVREVRRKGIDIVFALDISRSMLATDVAPSRLDAAVAEMERLMQRLEGDRVGLVVFAGIAFVQSPLTSDYGAIRLYLDRLDPEDLPVQGTAIGRALFESRQLLTGGEENEDFERSDTQLIVVFTDGEDHETEPVREAAEAYAQGIHVYTVGVGTADGSRIPIRNPDGSIARYFEDRQGNVVVTRLEEGQVREIATTGGGDYVRFSTEGAAAEMLNDAISEYDEASLSSALRQQYQDRFLVFLIPGLFFLLFGAWIGPRTTRRPLVMPASMLSVFLLFASGCGDSLMRPDPRVESAMELVAEGSAEPALEMIERARPEARDQAEFYYDRGLIHEVTESWRNAQDDFIKSLNADEVTEQVSAFVALGNSLLAQELYETAIERYRRALSLDPTHEGARRNMEIALMRLYPPCTSLDDEYEDNEGSDFAADLPASVYRGEHMPPGVQATPGMEEEAPTLVACGLDADWYAIPVLGGATLDVEVEFERLRDDTGHAPPPGIIEPTAVRIALIDVDGVTPIAVDQGLEEATMVDARTVERALTEIPISPTVEQGLAYLKVEVDAPLEYEYSIEITFTPPCYALEDEFESNDRRQHASSVENGRHQLRICESNADWFTGRAEVGGSLFVDVTPVQQDDGTQGLIDVGWFEGMNPVPAEQLRLTDRLAEFSARDVLVPSEFSWSVESAAGTEGGYAMDMYAYGPCPDNDRYEPNDTNQQAHAIDMQQDPPPLRHLRLCAGDQDWFAVPLPPVEEEDREEDYRSFSAMAEIPELTRDIWVAVYDPQTGQQLAVSQPVEMAPQASFAGSDPPASGVVAYTRLPWETQQVVIVVVGQDEGFYHLSFPLTEEQQQQQQEQQQQEQEESEDSESEESEDSESEQQEPQEPEEQEGEEEAEPEPEESSEEEEGEQPEPTPEEETEEEQEREMLLQMLNNLEPEDVNLPLQQALEAARPSGLQNEW